MNWNIIIVFACFVLSLIAFAICKRKGVIDKEEIKALGGIASGLQMASEVLTVMNDSTTCSMINTIFMFVKNAVLAAENAWYNDEIDKDDRYLFCNEKLDEMFEAYGIQLDESQNKIIDTLISAACEEIGHIIVEADEEE